VAEVLNQARWFADAFLRSYSQLFFSRSRTVGGLMVVASAFDFRMFAFGVGAAILSIVSARLLRFDRSLIIEGVYSYNSVLVSLGIASLLENTPLAIVLAVAGAILTVLVTAATRSGTYQSGLPILTIPFVIVFYLAIATSTSLGFSLSLLPTGPPMAFLPGWLALYFKSLGMIFFLPRFDVGLVLFLALLVHSRIATLFSLLALGVALLVMQISALSVLAGEALPLLLTLNLIFTAIALGGVWFVPSRSSVVLALVGVVAAAAITISTAPILAMFGLPTLVPFNFTAWLMLYALRQRTQDGQPKSVDFLPGTPEQNYAFHRTHLFRFGTHYAARLRAPFNGVWTCTQGVDGDFTHQGVWRNAFDFEVAGEDGAVFTGEGTDVQDYRCYGLPVLATAAGTVARVISDIPDNLIGKPNVDQNWGNLVLTYHAPGLYSLICHLKPGSIKVAEGDWVIPGQVLGHCGNSGRSPIPHLHFQLQALPQIGAPTIFTELHDVIRVDTPPELLATTVVEKDQHIRNIRRDDSFHNRLCAFTPGAEFELVTDKHTETIKVSIDLYGRNVLTSSNGAKLFFERDEDRFIVFDVSGPRSSALYVIRAVLGRVPFDDEIGLVWSDYLPFGLVYGPIIRTIYEFLSPFFNNGGIKIQYTTERDGAAMVINGQTLLTRSGKPRMTTHARLETHGGLVEATVTTPHRVIRVLRKDVDSKETK